MLRESAMCPDADKAAFEDIAKHKFFNTNNLWVNLPKLQARAALKTHPSSSAPVPFSIPAALQVPKKHVHVEGHAQCGSAAL